MLSYEENVRAILECCFSQSKDEIIESAVKAIMALNCEPIPSPYITTPNYPQYPYGTPVITCTATVEDLKKLQNPDTIE